MQFLDFYKLVGKKNR